MDRIEEEREGKATQKVKAFGIAVIMLMAATCFCFVTASDDSDAMNVDGDVTFAKVGTTTSFTITDYESALYYTAELLDSDDIANTAAISTSYAKGQLSLSSDVYQKTISVTCPEEAGDYRMHVVFYKDAEYAEQCGEKYIPLKVVDPIVLKVTLKNTGKTDVTFTAYFVIDGEKVDDSEQSVTVTAGSTKDVTYDYVVKSPSNTTYKLCTDDATINSVAGLGVEKKFYTSQNDSTLMTVLAVVTIIILLVLIFVLLRKPVVNKGKPKGRR